MPSPHGTCLCFGPVVPDGYGAFYNPRESQFIETLHFLIALHHTNLTHFFLDVISTIVFPFAVGFKYSNNKYAVLFKFISTIN